MLVTLKTVGMQKLLYISDNSFSYDNAATLDPVQLHAQAKTSLLEIYSKKKTIQS